ncbi:hypothetical protein SLEP1_g11206 [Rubroshorea leprosula]|uniref:Homeobox domain-containing protein n=1 Tax=Rubroshorea leprosula TaxID=152421 RepID=A0AAV5IGF8_9ROSI|nr:hypothetical protein SLEP1_g11206 [Rubroshorea leprosula]
MMEGRNQDTVRGGIVITEEQMELLRKQIAAFVVISEQLAEMYRTINVHQGLYGVMLGNPYCGPEVASSAGHPVIQISVRQRWNPTPKQLQILETIYEQGQGTPSKHTIKEITAQLIQFGQVTESNVYNWFQNRRARSKKKQFALAAKSEGDTGVLSTKEKMMEPENIKNLAESAENSTFEDSEPEIGMLIGETEGPQSYSSYNLVDQLRFL